MSYKIKAPDLSLLHSIWLGQCTAWLVGARQQRSLARRDICGEEDDLFVIKICTPGTLLLALPCLVKNE
jgi:hypothetical protein